MSENTIWKTVAEDLTLAEARQERDHQREQGWQARVVRCICADSAGWCGLYEVQREVLR